jgi:hypothetical protein
VDKKELADPSHVDEDNERIGPQMSNEQCEQLSSEFGFPITGDSRCKQTGETGEQEDAQAEQRAVTPDRLLKDESDHDKDVPAERWTKYDWE